MESRPSNAGAGRTDAGVHAEKQVVGFRTVTTIPVDRFPHALNHFLPPDIVVHGAREAEETFHPRFSARSKVYRYTILRVPFPSPFLRRYTWHRPGELDVDAMARAAAHLVGRRDFRSFAGAGRPVRDAVRTVFRCEVTQEGPLLMVRVEADGFLYKMVRTIVGTLMEVGCGRWKPERIPEILAACDRRLAGRTAPAQGLCLEDVRY